MTIRQFVVDAFASRPFRGNPAAICPLARWPEDGVLQAIAAENNLSETAFMVPVSGSFELRWFTPVAEVDLCGHATLAAAHVLFHHLGLEGEQVSFFTRSGELVVKRQPPYLCMALPASDPQPCTAPPALLQGLGGTPEACLAAEDYLVVYADERAVRALTPDLQLLTRIGLRGVIVTAPGTDCDFVSRFFAPKLGIEEDPVTGSAHCQLAPYWSGRLGKNPLSAVQVSARQGEIGCQLEGDRVLLFGRAVTFLQGEILLEP